MKFIAENIKKLSQKNKERNVKRSIRMVKNEIKLEAKGGKNRCIVFFHENLNDNQQEIISDYFIKRNFEVEWRFNDEIVVKWV